MLLLSEILTLLHQVNFVAFDLDFTKDRLLTQGLILLGRSQSSLYVLLLLLTLSFYRAKAVVQHLILVQPRLGVLLLQV